MKLLIDKTGLTPKHAMTAEEIPAFGGSSERYVLHWNPKHRASGWLVGHTDIASGRPFCPYGR
jgi:hypothetical protein